MSVWPVTQPDSSEAKKTATWPMSWGWAMRPSGVRASVCLRNSLSASPPAQAFGFDQARVQRVDTNLPRAELLRERDRQGVDGGLGGAVHRSAADGHRSDDRADVDNRSAGRVEMPDGFLRGEQQSQHVEVEEFVKVLGRDRVERQKLIEARVVDQDVERAKRRDTLCKQTLDVVGPRDVGLDGDGLAPLFSNTLDDGFGAGLATGVVDHDRRSLGREMFGDRCANAFGSSGDDGDFSYQTAHGNLLLCSGACQMGMIKFWRFHQYCCRAVKGPVLTHARSVRKSRSRIARHTIE